MVGKEVGIGWRIINSEMVGKFRGWIDESGLGRTVYVFTVLGTFSTRDPEHCHRMTVTVLILVDVRSLYVNCRVKTVDRRDSELAYTNHSKERIGEASPNGCVKGVLGV
jgi:hypothetical protein